METVAVLIWGLIVWISVWWAATYAIKTPNDTVEEMKRKAYGKS
jgi:hypothetical protein